MGNIAMSPNSTTMATGTERPTDPVTQNFTIYLKDGTEVTASLAEIDCWYAYNVNVSIEYAVQLGASLILLIAIALLSKPDKRHSPIFIINAAALFFNFIQHLLSCLYFTGPFSEIYAYLTLDYTSVPRSAYGVSVTAELFVVVVLVLIQLSLLLQAQVVCLSLRRIYRNALLMVSSIIASFDIGWRLYLAVLNIQSILYTEASVGDLSRIESISNFVTTAAIFWFSAVFVAKLGHAIHRRRKLGLRSWGSMQIIFVMGCQTMIIPAIFSALQYLIDFPAIGSFVLTIVAIFLPLSSLWATTAINDAKPILKPLILPQKAFGVPNESILTTTTWISPTKSRFGTMDV